MKLSIIIPAYNEKTTIGAVLERVRSVRLPAEKEIVVVDDGSTDGTAELLDKEKGILVLHQANAGKGAALAAGFAAASGDAVVIQDADLEYEPDDFPALLEPLMRGEADVVYGSRFAGDQVRVRMFWHTVANRILTLASNVLLGMRLTDMMTCYKMARADWLRRIRIDSRGFEVEPELTVKLARLGARFREVPVRYHGRTYMEGKKIRFHHFFTVLWALARYRFFWRPPTS